MKEVPVHVCAYILVFVFQRNPYGTIFELPPKIVGLHNAICIFMICKFWQLRIRDQKICTTIWARIWVGKVLYRHRKRKCIFPTTGCCLFFFSRQNLFFPAKTCFFPPKLVFLFLIVIFFLLQRQMTALPLSFMPIPWPLVTLRNIVHNVENTLCYCKLSSTMPPERTSSL